MANQGPFDREASIARVLRPLGRGPLTLRQARRAGQLLGMHWASAYRLRRRFLADPVASSVKRAKPGPKEGARRLSARVEAVVEEVLTDWLPRQRHLAHPLLDLFMEVRRRCVRAGLQPPSRNTVARRWAQHREAMALEQASAPSSSVAPGSLVARRPLEIVQIDHTQADVLVVDEWLRRPIGRPWLTLALDVATRCVVGLYLSMERPSAATVALVLSRIVLPKAPWLATLAVEVDWPMHGLPTVLHLDNAAEFRSRALRAGCSQYGVELMYRPVRRPHFGGHIERECAQASNEERLAHRRERSLPALAKLRDWLEKTRPVVAPQTALGKALAYLDKYWSRLVRYTERGDLPIDNNRAENAIRPFVVGRKAWLFCDTPAGANASALIYSLVESRRTQ